VQNRLGRLARQREGERIVGIRPGRDQHRHESA
jgi:hypothetical protein